MTSQDNRIFSGCHLPILTHQRMHTPPTQEVNHEFQEALRRWTKTDNNADTPGYWRDLHLLAVSLCGWPNHHLQICPAGLLS